MYKMTTGKLQADDTLKALLIAIQKLGEGTHAGEKERKNGAKTEMEEDGMDSKIYSKANIRLGEKKVCKKTKKTFIGNKRHRKQRSLDREISSYRKASPRSDKGQASSSDSSDDEMEKLKEALDRHVKVRQGIGVGWERTPFVFTQGGKDTISTIDEGNEEEYDSDDERSEDVTKWINQLYFLDDTHNELANSAFPDTEPTKYVFDNDRHGF